MWARKRAVRLRLLSNIAVMVLGCLRLVAPLYLTQIILDVTYHQLAEQDDSNISEFVEQLVEQRCVNYGSYHNRLSTPRKRWHSS